jgi:hypothetical protein
MWVGSLRQGVAQKYALRVEGLRTSYRRGLLALKVALAGTVVLATRSIGPKRIRVREFHQRLN